MGLIVGRAQVVKGLEPVMSFDTKRVRNAFNQFEECCPTPTLWERAFYELLDCFEDPAASTKAFNTLDSDSDGFVDARELLGALAILSSGHLTDRLTLLFDIFDLNKERDMGFDEAFLMVRRTTWGLRKMTGLVAPPEEVVEIMVKQIWKSAKKHRDVRIQIADWQRWWERDATCRSALKAFIWRPEDQRGLPTPDHWIEIDYTKGVKIPQESASQPMVPVPPTNAKKGPSRPLPSSKNDESMTDLQVATTGDMQHMSARQVPGPVADYESLLNEGLTDSPFLQAVQA
jgi:hypothetical protein